MPALRIVVTAFVAPPLFVATLACATAAAASWLGQGSVRWDLLTHFAPIWLAGGLLGLAGAVLFRGFDRLLLAGAGLVAVVAAGGLVAPELLRDAGPKAARDAPGAIKVIQFNVWHGNDRVADVVDWLKREDPDIAVLEETTPRIRRALFAERRWHASCSACEVVILSKRPPVSIAPPRGLPQAPGPLSRATFRDARGEFTVLGVHYAWPTDPRTHQAQERRLAAAIHRFPRDRTIVGGDLNAAPWSFYRRKWDREFGLIRRNRAMPTFPAPLANRWRWLGITPTLAIDHVYAGPGWATVSVRRGPRLGSDHYPVIVTLAPVSPP